MILLSFQSEVLQSDVGSEVNEVATEMNFVAVVRNFEVIEDKLFDFLKQVSDYDRLLEVSLEHFFLKGVIRVTVSTLKFAFEPGVDVQLAHGLDFGEVGDDGLQVNLGFFFVFEEAVFYECHQVYPLSLVDDEDLLEQVGDPDVLDPARVDYAGYLLLCQCLDGWNSRVSQQFVPHPAQRPRKLRVFVRVFVVVHRVVVLRVKVYAFIWIPVAYDVTESPSPMLFNNVLLKHLTWLVYDEMG